MRWFWIFSISIILSGCGTYRTGGGYRGAGGYKGMGGFKPPSDYAKPADSSSVEISNGVDAGDYGGDELRAREKLNTPGHYIPRSAFKLYWPVELVRINRGFRPASDPRHEGVDLGGRRGTPILAAHEGLVIYAGNGFSGYGNMVMIEYDGQWATLYGHLDEITTRAGQIVQPGDPIGAMGATGHATGVHLHFELMQNRLPIDPVPFLTGPNKFTTGKLKGRRSAQR